MSEPLYELVDIGANLGHPSFSADYEHVLERARQAGISKLMLTGTSEKLTDEVAELAKRHPNFLYYTAGVHPHDAKDFCAQSTISFLRRHLTENSASCVAVGECGLDFNRNFSPRDQQLDAFGKQVELACELQKPLFVHEREAHDEMVRILSSHRLNLPPTVIHCFTGSATEARKYVEMGLYIGLTGFLWKDRSENGVKFALRNGDIPLDRLVLETDAPFMFPKINDKKIPAEIRATFTEPTLALHKFGSFNRNEPCTLSATCELIAAFLEKPPTEVAEVTTRNAKNIYGLN